MSFQVINNMLRGGGAGARELVGAGRGDGYARRAYQRQGNRVIGHAHSNRVHASGEISWHSFMFVQDQRQRARSKALKQPISCLRDRIRNMRQLG